MLWRYLYLCLCNRSINCNSRLVTLSIHFAENSIGPIIATVCIVLGVHYYFKYHQLPVIERNVKPYLFTSRTGGMERLLYIGTTEDGGNHKGTIENWAAIRKTCFYFAGTYFILVSASVITFKRKDIFIVI